MLSTVGFSEIFGRNVLTQDLDVIDFLRVLPLLCTFLHIHDTSLDIRIRFKIPRSQSAGCTLMASLQSTFALGANMAVFSATDSPFKANSCGFERANFFCYRRTCCSQSPNIQICIAHR